jgi:ribosomal protein L11 methyltransferase
VAVEVRPERAEEARAAMLELFPEGFEEVERAGGVELAAYTTAAGEERIWQVFGGARASDVDADWEVRWRDFHRPVRLGPLWVGPPWETPDPDAVAVVVDPGRAFGTGAHPTTQLCLELLLELERGSLLDVGCGSGVLAIAAALSGFAPVAGVDVEAASIAATVENAAANGVDVSAQRVGPDDPLPPADVAVANISLDAVLRLPGRLSAPVVVTSGYLETEEPDLAGYRRGGRRARDGWAADVHRRT